VRRVKRLQPLASDGSHQGELFATYRHHAFITNSTLTTLEADQRHRDHAIIEQVIAELKDRPLAHLPSGKYAANAAWVSCAVIAFNLARAAAVAADLIKARWATLRTKIINVPARGRRHRPPPGPAPSHRLALGTRLDPAVVDRDRTPSHRHLTNQPQRARPRNTNGKPGQTGNTTTPERRRAATNRRQELRRWIRAEGAPRTGPIGPSARRIFPGQGHLSHDQHPEDRSAMKAPG
jgi:hypothetical protein